MSKPVYRDERGRFRKRRFEEMSAIEQFAHTHIQPMVERHAKMIADQALQDAAFFSGGPHWRL